MPLCSFICLRNILMTVLLCNILNPDNRNCLAAAAPSHSLKLSTTRDKGSVSENVNHEQSALKLLEAWKVPNASKSPTLKEDAPISSPSNIELAFISISSVLITWSYPTNDHAHFLVQTSHDGDPYVNVSELLNSTQFVYTEMLYSAYYQFRVVAYVGGVASPPAETDYFVNGITAPPGPPVNIVAMVTSHDIINLQWDAPNTPSPVIYAILWGKHEADLDQEKTVMLTTHMSFPNLHVNTSYYFRVRAEINSWKSIPSNVVSATTPPPKLPPLTTQAANISDTWVLVQWSSPPDDRYPKTITNFKILYTIFQHNSASLSADPHYTNVSVVDFTGRELNLTGLQPGSTLVVGMAYTSDEFLSELSKPLYLEIEESGNKFNILKPSTIQLTWTVTSCDCEVHMIRLEDVRCSLCTAISSTELQVEWKVLTNSNKTHTIRVLENGVTYVQINATDYCGEIVLSGLHPWTGHSFTVALETTFDDWRYDPCPVLNCWTLETAPTQPPTNFKTTNFTSHSVTLTWSEPPLNSQNGLLTKYIIGFQCIPEYPAQYCGTRQVEVFADRSNDLSVTIDSLESFTTYLFVVAASTGAGRGPNSFPLTIKTTEEAPSDPPTVTNITSITATSLCVVWRPPPFGLHNRPIRGYVVTLERIPHLCEADDYPIFGELQQSANILMMNINNGTRTRLFVKNLLPYTGYIVRVSAINDAGGSPLSEGLCVSTLQSKAITELIDMNFTASLGQGSSTNSTCFNLTFNWNWPFSFQNTTSESLYHGTKVSVWTINLFYQPLDYSEDRKTGSILISANSVVTMSTAVDSSDDLELLKGENVSFWLQANGSLSNGLNFNVNSPRRWLLLPGCVQPSKDTPKRKIIIITACLLSLIISAAILCITSCCRYFIHKWRKQRTSSSQPSLQMDNFAPPDSHDSNLTLDPSLRVSDGRSSDEEESVGNSDDSLAVNASENSSSSFQNSDTELLDLCASGDSWILPPTTSSPVLTQASGMSAIGTQLPTGLVYKRDNLEAATQPHVALPLAPRQVPDGCSLCSSTSSELESLPLLDNEHN